MLGRFCAIEAICSRSVVVSERVGRLRKVFTKAASSALRAASPGDAVSPRVIFAGFNALDDIFRRRLLRGVADAQSCGQGQADCHEDASQIDPERVAVR